MGKEFEEQQALKFRDHDLTLDCMSKNDIEMVRGMAIRSFVDTKQSDTVAAIIEAFMSYLVAKGYRITEVKK